MGKPDSGSCYRIALAQKGFAGLEPGMLGFWVDEPQDRVPQLHQELADLEQDHSTEILKSTHRSLVYRAQVFGKDTLVKKSLFSSFGLRMKYLFRQSRGRRAWAAAQTLRELDIPTPEPYGFLEMRKNGLPVTGYYLSEFVSDAVEARKWVRPYYHQQTSELREQIRGETLALLLNLYQNQIYHADTKTRNILLRAPTDDARRAYYWIDLECMQFGVNPSRRQIIRNLVQLNGSLGSKVSETDRLAFLHDMAETYPWLKDPAIEKEIRRWTLERLEKELRREERP